MANATFWVAVNGSASGDGSQGNPFDSIARAQQAVRDLLSTGPQEQDITVKIGGGTYELSQPLVFTAADSGKDGHVVHYEAVTGETPVISGGRAVGGWTAVTDPGLGLAPGATLWKAHVGTGIDTRQLYIDGERATRAETNPAATLDKPVYPEGFRPTSNMGDNINGIDYAVTSANSSNWNDPARWTNVGDIEAVLYDQWRMTSVPLSQVDTAHNLLKLDDSNGAWTNANLSRQAPNGLLVDNLSYVLLDGQYSSHGITKGMNISAVGIPSGTTITNVDSKLNILTISNPVDLPDGQKASLSAALTISDPTTGKVVAEGPGIWSFWRVTKFENAYQFLDQPREWYLDRSTGDLYLVGEAGFNPNGHDVQMPVLQQLLVGKGTAAAPVSNLVFDGLDFRYATWLAPNGADGYVSDQSGFRVVGTGHPTDVIGHTQNVERTPGNISIEHGSNIVFTADRFSHLGAVGVDFLPGAQGNGIYNSIFEDISSAAIQFGGVSAADARPSSAAGITRDNAIVGNIIGHAGAEYVDAAGIFIGFAKNTLISDNYISDVPWSGIAMGWGWGLMDAGGFAGLPGATAGMWGPGGQPYASNNPTIMEGNRIVGNTITRFLETLWDGGAVYTTGFQGTGFANGTLIANNYFYDKRADGAGNVIYTDGGTRYVTVDGNILLHNLVGKVDMGAPFSATDPLNGEASHNPFNIYPLINGSAYGSEIGGCVTYGDIAYLNNIWENRWTTNPFSAYGFNPSNWPNNPLFYDPEPQNWTPSLSFLNNKIVSNTLFDNLLVLTRASAIAVSRMDDHGGTVTFGLQSLRDGHDVSLLSDAAGRDPGAVPWGFMPTSSWLASEHKALGTIGGLDSLIGSGVWLPTASIGGTSLSLKTVQLGANSVLATFEGGYQANIMLGGTRSILDGDAGNHPALEVMRLAGQNNGLAIYEADRATGAVTLGGRTVGTGDSGYLQTALAKARADGLVLGPDALPAFGKQAVLHDLPLDPAKNYAILLIVNNDPNTLFSSYSKANPHGDVQIVTLDPHGRGVTYGIEDVAVSSGHSDRDYNDLIVSFNFNHPEPL